MPLNVSGSSSAGPVGPNANRYPYSIGKDLPDYGLNQELDLNNVPEPSEPSGYNGRQITALNSFRTAPNQSSNDYSLAIQAGNIREAGQLVRTRHEKAQDTLDYKSSYERLYQDSIESLAPSKTPSTPAPIEIDMQPDAPIKPVKPLSSEPALEPVKKDVQKEEPATEVKKPGGFSFGGIINWFTGLFKGSKDDKAKENPLKADFNPIDPAKMEEMIKLIEKMHRETDRMREINYEMDGLLASGEDKTEAYYRNQYIQRLKEHINLKERESLAAADRVFALHEEIKLGQKTAMELAHDIQKREKTNKILGWVDTAGTGICIGVGAVSAGLFIASFFTAGATLPGAMAALAVAGGAGGIAQGVATIQKAVLGHKTKEQQAELLGISEQRERAQEAIEQNLREWKEDTRSITSSWSSLKQFIDKQNDTISSLK